MQSTFVGTVPAGVTGGDELMVTIGSDDSLDLYVEVAFRERPSSSWTEGQALESRPTE